MTDPLARIRRGAVFLGGFLVLAACVHFLLSDEATLLDSVYWCVITVTGVGFTEKSSVSPAVQVWTIVVIAVGMSAVAYVIGAMLQIMAEGEITRLMGVRRMTQDIDDLRGHVIVCGYGRIGKMLGDDLRKHHVDFVALEVNAERIAEGQTTDHLVMQADATDEEALQSAGIERAKTLVTALGNDADNVFLTLTARNLNPNLQIIARGEHPTSERKLLQAGADRVVMPALIGARRIATLITRPHMAELIESVTDTSKLDVELEEISVPANSRLVNKTVHEAEAHKRHGLLVVSARHADGEMVFNPDADHTFYAGDTMVVMGKRGDISKFREWCVT